MKDRRLLETAYNVRQGMIGILGSCNCGFPLVPYPTDTKHAPECCAHYMLVYASATAEERAGAGDVGRQLAELSEKSEAARVARNGGGS